MRADARSAVSPRIGLKGNAGGCDEAVVGSAIAGTQLGDVAMSSCHTDGIKSQLAADAGEGGIESFLFQVPRVAPDECFFHS